MPTTTQQPAGRAIADRHSIVSRLYAVGRNRYGLLAPLAAVVALAVAGRKCSPTIGQQLRTVHPSGAAVIFAAAYIAGLAGSVTAPVVVAAFLAGLFLVKTIKVDNQIIKPRPIVAATGPSSAPSSPTSAGQATQQPAYNIADLVPVDRPAVGPFDMLAAAGLAVSQVTLKQPGANGKAPRVSSKP